MITVISVTLNPAKFRNKPLEHDEIVELKKEMGRSCEGIQVFLEKISIRPGMTPDKVEFMEMYLQQCGHYEDALRLIINTTPVFAPALFHGSCTVGFENSYYPNKNFDIENIYIAKEHIVYEFVENIFF